MIDYTKEEYDIVIKVMEETNGSRREMLKVNAKDFGIAPVDNRQIGTYFTEYKNRIEARTLTAVSKKFARGCSFRDFFEKRFTDDNYKTIAKSIYSRITEEARKKIAEEYPQILEKFESDYNTVIQLIDEGEKPLDVLNDFEWTGRGIADFISSEAQANIALATDNDLYSETVKLAEYIKELLTGKKSDYEECDRNMLTFFIYQQEHDPEEIREAIIARRREGDGFVETLVNQLFSLKNIRNVYPIMQVTFEEPDTAFRILTEMANNDVIDFSGAKLMLSENGRPVSAKPVKLEIIPEVSSDMLG